MSTWLKLEGNFPAASPEKMVELRKTLGEEDITVEDNGSFYFAGETGYSMCDRVRKLCQEFSTKYQLAGSMCSKQDDWDEDYHDFFGTLDDHNRQIYWHLKGILDVAQTDFDAYIETCEEKDIARWILERGTTPS